MALTEEVIHHKVVLVAQVSLDAAGVLGFALHVRLDFIEDHQRRGGRVPHKQDKVDQS